MDLEAFLGDHRAQGQWDSQGVFTLAAAQAREKLARSALKIPQLYILKLVQAGVALGATRMRVDGFRNGLTLWFDAPSAPTPDGVLRALSGEAVGDEGLRLLGEGMNVALFLEPAALALHHWSGDGEGWALSFRGEELASGPAPARPDQLPEEGPLWLFSLQKPGYHFLRSPVEAEMSWLHSRCTFMPIDFKIRGHQLYARPERSGAAEPMEGRHWLVERHEVGASSMLVEPPDRQPGGSEIKAGWLRQRMFGGLTLWQRTKGGYDENPALCRAVYLLPEDLTGADTVAFVRHGVIVARVKVTKTGAGGLALLDASLVNFDISGFEVVRDEKLDEAMRTAGRVWSGMLQEMRPLLERAPGPLQERTQPEKGPGCCLLWLLFCSAEPVGWTIGALTLGAWGVYRHAYPFQPQVPDEKKKSVLLQRVDWLLATESWPWPAGGGPAEASAD